MGRTSIPKYRIEYRDNLLAMGKTAADMGGICGKPVLTMAWNVKSLYNGNVTGNGTPNVENLKAWRDSMHKSFNKGGSNYHISEAFGIPHIQYCAIVRQADRKVMCEFHAPMFEVV